MEQNTALLCLLRDEHDEPMDGTPSDSCREGVALLTEHVTAKLEAAFALCGLPSSYQTGAPTGLAGADTAKLRQAQGALEALLLGYLDRKNRMPGQAVCGLLDLMGFLGTMIDQRIALMEWDIKMLQIKLKKAKQRKAGKGGVR